MLTAGYAAPPQVETPAPVPAAREQYLTLGFVSYGVATPSPHTRARMAALGRRLEAPLTPRSHRPVTSASLSAADPTPLSTPRNSAT